jgi:two-component system, LuxR family, sensor kinase FixL
VGRESDTDYLALFDASPDAMVILDSDGLVLDVNERLESLFGYPRDLLLGQSAELLVVGLWRAAHVPPDPTRPNGGPIADLYGLRRDGTQFPAEISVSQMLCSGESLTIAAIRDGTARKKVDDKFRRLLEAAPDAMVIIDQTGHIQLVNAQVEALFGYSKQELMGKPVEVLIPQRYHSTHPGHRTNYFVQPRTRPMGAGGLSLFGLRKDGTEFPAEILLSPLESDAGNLAITAVRDVTDRKRAEEERSRLFQAEEAIRIRDDFLSIASHELKTPLTTLQMQAESAIRASTRQNNHPIGPGLIRKLEDMFAAIRRLSSLIDQLLDLSRLTAGKLILHKERMDLSAATGEVVNQFRDELERTGSNVRLLADTPVWGFWDPFRIERIVTNLISNAIKYGQGKPIEVMVNEVADRRARLSVRDHGIGIASEHRDRIFERFERLVSSRQYGGLGLGLWIVRQIVEAHGGSISVWSQPGAGSIFTVDLPLEASEQVALKPHTAGDGALIMLVDDDPMIRNTFCEVVQDEGFNVVAASNGRDALRLLQSGTKPQLIFLDLMMPEMDGWEFRAEQQKLSDLKHTPVIIVSAAEGVDKIAETLGVSGYLKKPIQLDSLFRLIGRYCVAQARDQEVEQGSGTLAN